LTTDLPARNSAGARALAAVTGPDPRRFPVYDVIELRADDGLRVLRDYSQGRRSRR
jgi:hypothetical protein